MAFDLFQARGWALLLAALSCLPGASQTHSWTAREPTNLRELNAWYCIPEGATNAADYYLRGFQRMKVREISDRWPELPLLGRGGWGEWPPAVFPLSSNVRSALVEVVRENKEALALFKRGNAHPQARYPVVLATNFLMLHLRDLGFAVRLTLLAGVHAWDAGRAEDAAGWATDAFRLAWSLRQEPVMLSQGQRARLWNDCVVGLGWMLDQGLSPNSLISLSELLKQQIAEDENGELFSRAFVGERVFFQECYLQLDLEGWREAFPRRVPAGEYERDLLRLAATPIEDERRFYDDFHARVVALRRKPYPERLQAMNFLLQQQATARVSGRIRCHQALDWRSEELTGEAVMLAQSRMLLLILALKSY